MGYADYFYQLNRRLASLHLKKTARGLEAVKEAGIGRTRGE
jgi:hypothetical protein